MKCLYSILFYLFINYSYSQNGVIYSNFSALKVDKSIRIDFTLNAGSTCYGIDVERGMDSTFLNPIGSIPGQCGSPSEPILYTYIDENPVLNGLNYYRLNFGGAEYSEIISIYFVSTLPKVTLIYPNPSYGQFILNFENKMSEKRQIEIVSTLGTVIFNSSTDKETLSLDLSHISQGIYYVKIYDENFISLISSGIIDIL